MKFRLMRGSGGFGGVVVAHQCDAAAGLRGAGQISVAENVARAIDTRSFAVPHYKHAIELALAMQLSLLRTPQRGGGEFFVETSLELDVSGGELLGRPRELLIETAERRTPITGQKACGFQAGDAVARLLH